MDLLFIWFVFLCSVLCSDHHRLSLRLLTVVFWEFRSQKKRQKSLWWQSESRIWICGSRNEPVWIKRLLTLIQRGSLANGSLRERAGGFIKALLFHTAEHSAATLAAASSCCDVMQERLLLHLICCRLHLYVHASLLCPDPSHNQPKPVNWINQNRPKSEPEPSHRDIN